MKIQEVNLKKELFNDGLGDISMKRLGEIVILAGANGAGKTRILNRIETCVNNYKNKPEENDLQDKIKSAQSLLKQQNIKQGDIKTCESVINSSQKELKHQKCLYFDSDYDSYTVINFVPTLLAYESPKNMTLARIEQIYSNQKSSHNLSGKDTYTYITKVARKHFSATHQATKQNQDTKNDIQEYDDLNTLIRSFLITDLTYYDDEARLYNLPLSRVNLSDGQKVLLQLCVAIHVQHAKLENVIILMDEPENHLHPSALTDYMNRVKSILTNCQIWIATHSIHLMSMLDASSIWYIKDGVPEYAGRSPEKVLEGLIGDEEQSQKLKDFINLPAEYAINQFTLQCLGAPTVSDAGKDDPQNNQIHKILKEKSQNTKIRILDYGAGKGRMLDGLNYSYNKNLGQAIDQHVDYYAFDKYETDKNTCKSVISSIYDNPDQRYFNAETAAQSRMGNNKLDVVVLCNVLHEIPPTEWKRIFRSDALIYSCLKDDGHLLIVEDLLIPVGEKPNSLGFFVLSQYELQKLFSLSPENIYVHYENDERLSAVMISKKHLSNISDESVRDTIDTLRKRSIEEIERIRNLENINYKDGKKLAFWLNQLANAVLYLDRQ